MNDDMSPAAVLNRAADYIEAHGWTRGAYDRDGRVCLLGAISKARSSASTPERLAGTLACMEALHRTIGCRGTLTRWNDAQKSRKPVIAALRAAAQAAS